MVGKCFEKIKCRIMGRVIMLGEIFNLVGIDVNDKVFEICSK